MIKKINDMFSDTGINSNLVLIHSYFYQESWAAA